jgi:hypothetical protein
MTAAVLLLLGLILVDPTGPSLADRTKRGEEFLVGLFDPTMDLLPEFAGSTTYWLYHDNYLAAHRLDRVQPDLARRIRAKTRSLGVNASGKIEIVLGDSRADALPFRGHRLDEVARVGDKVIRTERVVGEVHADWRSYADLLALAVLADAPESAANWDRLEHFWDGKGFADRVTRASGMYATYKLALGLLAARKAGRRLAFEKDLVDRLFALQHPSGGWITDYRADGTPEGLANVETTCLVLLALDRLMEEEARRSIR